MSKMSKNGNNHPFGGVETNKKEVSLLQVLPIIEQYRDAYDHMEKMGYENLEQEQKEKLMLYWRLKKEKEAIDKTVELLEIEIDKVHDKLYPNSRT